MTEVKEQLVKLEKRVPLSWVAHASLITRTLLDFLHPLALIVKDLFVAARNQHFGWDYVRSTTATSVLIILVLPNGLEQYGKLLYLLFSYLVL